MKWQEGLKKIKVILKEEPVRLQSMIKRPPRRVYIRGRKVISRVPIKQEG
ncbi:hypothetical protein KAW48_03235 [candidate division WOR-3 bacterium]|nr:hypothetical protein [candidate division WOR-3 bacterium]